MPNNNDNNGKRMSNKRKAQEINMNRHDHTPTTGDGTGAAVHRTRRVDGTTTEERSLFDMIQEGNSRNWHDPGISLESFGHTQNATLSNENFQTGSAFQENTMASAIQQLLSHAKSQQFRNQPGGRSEDHVGIQQMLPATPENDIMQQLQMFISANEASDTTYGNLSSLLGKSTGKSPYTLGLLRQPPENLEERQDLFSVQQNDIGANDSLLSSILAGLVAQSPVLAANAQSTQTNPDFLPGILPRGASTQELLIPPGLKALLGGQAVEQDQTNEQTSSLNTLLSRLANNPIQEDRQGAFSLPALVPNNTSNFAGIFLGTATGIDIGTTSDNTDAGTAAESMIRIPCKARGMEFDHNPKSAYFEITANAKHGEPLTCSHPDCRVKGVRFLFCAYCKAAVAKGNFASRHNHLNSKHGEEGSTAAKNNPNDNNSKNRSDAIYTENQHQKSLPCVRDNDDNTSEIGTKQTEDGRTNETKNKPAKKDRQESFRAFTQQLERIRRQQDDDAGEILSRSTITTNASATDSDGATNASATDSDGATNATTSTPPPSQPQRDSLFTQRRRQRWLSLLDSRPNAQQRGAMESWLTRVLEISDPGLMTPSSDPEDIKSPARHEGY